MKGTLRPFDQLARGAQRPPQDVALLTEAEACAKVRVFDACRFPVRAFQKWARRYGVPVKYVGRGRVYDPRVLDAFLERESWTRRHRLTKAS